MTPIKDQEQGFRLISINEMLEYVKVHQGERIKQIEYNYANVYKFNTGEYGIAPQIGKYCLIVSNSSLLDSFIANRKFPVLLETDHFDELNQMEILKLKDSFEFFLNELKNTLKVDFDLTDRNMRYHLTEINEKVNEVLRRSDLSEDLCYLLNIYLLFVFKNVVDGEIEFKPNYTLNVFYSPFVKDKSGNIFAFTKKIYEQANRKKVDFEYILKLEKARSLGYAVFSKEHMEYFKTGNIFD